MRSRPTAAELELSVRASHAERRRADAGGEARGRRARGSPAFARRQPERRRPRNVRHPAHGRRRLRPRGRPRASPRRRRRRRRRRAVGRTHRPRRRRGERLGRGATMLRDFTENRRRRQLRLRRVVGRRLGYGAVHAAAARMDCDMVRLLVASGADPNRRARNTDTKDAQVEKSRRRSRLSGARTSPSEDSTTPHSTSPSPPTSTRRPNDASRRTPRARARPRAAAASPAAFPARASDARSR